MDEYDLWISKNVTKSLGMCREVTENMARLFPELTRVRGHYHCPVWGEREHWWLVDVSGNVIDPTKSQFPSKGVGEYVEWDDSRAEPTGKCINCGDYVFDQALFCGEACEVNGV